MGRVTQPALLLLQARLPVRSSERPMRYRMRRSPRSRAHRWSHRQVVLVVVDEVAMATGTADRQVEPTRPTRLRTTLLLLRREDMARADTDTDTDTMRLHLRRLRTTTEQDESRTHPPTRIDAVRHTERDENETTEMVGMRTRRCLRLRRRRLVELGTEATIVISHCLPLRHRRRMGTTIVAKLYVPRWLAFDAQHKPRYDIEIETIVNSANLI